jgi:hypothetical protein
LSCSKEKAAPKCHPGVDCPDDVAREAEVKRHLDAAARAAKELQRDDAKREYEAALTLDPLSQTAKDGLMTLKKDAALERMQTAKRLSGDVDPPAAKGPRPKPDLSDGSYHPSTLRADPGAFIGADVTVTGAVIWIYDCTAEIGADLARQSPERCERPHFLLGDTAQTPKGEAMRVVDVPRAPRDDEKRYLPKEQLEAWPKVPQLTVGAVIHVQGHWDTRSPMGFREALGLLVWHGLAGDK